MSSEVLTLKIRNGRTIREIETWRVEDDSVAPETRLERVVKKCFASGGTKVSSHELVIPSYHESVQFAAHPHCISLTYVSRLCCRLLYRPTGLSFPCRFCSWNDTFVICLMHSMCPDDPNYVLWSKPKSLCSFPDTRVTSFLWPHITPILCSQTLSVRSLDTSCIPM